MALQKWKRKKEKASQEGNLEQLYQSCLELAGLYADQDEFDYALREYKEAKRAAEAANKIIDVAHVHRAIGDLYNIMLNHNVAIKHGLKHLELARSVNDYAEEQRALANLGHMYHSLADTFSNPQSSEKLDALDKAREYTLQSLQVCDRLTNISKKELFQMQAGAYLNLGLAVEQHNEEEAMSYYNKAINLCKSMDIWDTLYRTYYTVGSLFQQKSKHARALEYFDKALDAAQRLHDNTSVCHILLQKAEVLFDLPDFRGAKQCILKAYKMNTTNRSDVERKLRTVKSQMPRSKGIEFKSIEKEKLRHRLSLRGLAAVKSCEEKLLDTPDCDLVTKKNLYEKLGDGCVAMKNYSKALEYYYLMLETAKNLGESGEQLRPCFVSLSQTYKDNKQYDLAIKYLNEELDLCCTNPLEACKTVMTIAEVLEIKETETEQLIGMYQKARALAQSAGSFKLESRAMDGMIQVMKKENRLCEARKMEAELENMQEKFGPLSCSSESEEESTPDIGADICIEDLSDIEQESESNTAIRVRKKNPVTKFRRNEKGEFPLHTACINGNLTLVKKLLDQGHPVNVRDHSGWLPLHEACNHGYVDIVAELLDRGAAINDRGTETVGGMTPLMDAASCGNLDVIELLLERGASPVMRNNKRETVLDCLKEWRKRYIEDEKRDLDPATLKQFNALKKTLADALKKAGQASDIPRSPSPSYSGILCSTNLQRQSKASKNRIQKESFEDMHSQKFGTNSLRRITYSEEDLPSTSRRNYSDRENVPNSSGNGLRRNLTDRPSHHGTKATKEYEEAMKSLRRKSGPLARSPSPLSFREKSALVSEEEAHVIDDWLVDDIGDNNLGLGGRGVKRRRVHQFEGEPMRRGTQSFSPSSRRGSFRPLSPVNNSDSNDTEPNQQFDADMQNEDLSELTDLISSENQISQQDMLSQTDQSTSTLSRTYQVPLSVFGIVRNTMPPPAVEQLTTPPLPFTQNIPASQVLSTQQAPPNAIKVRVKDKLLLIPLPPVAENPPTIAWLAEETAKRYYSFEGMEPQLTLSTNDGALLAPHDPVTLLLGCPEVLGEVTNWKQHSVIERYREACTQLNTEADEYLERCLDVSQASLSLGLGGCELDPDSLAPVLRACAHLNCLQHLILSENRLGDGGMQLIASVVTKLPHLRELDLSCNGITYEGLNLFVQQVIEHQACKRLEVMRLCHNRLGKSCISLLSRLFPSVCPALSELSLAKVGLDHSSFVGIQFLPIDRLDVGHNLLGGEGVASLLRTLRVPRMEILRLPHCGNTVPGKVAQWLTTGDPCRLRTLDLAQCHDEPEAFTHLFRCLERAILLEHLELSCPEIKDLQTLQVLLRLPKLSILRLPGVPVHTNALPINPLTLQFSCVSLDSSPAPPWASQGPYGFLTNSPNLV